MAVKQMMVDSYIAELDSAAIITKDFEYPNPLEAEILASAVLMDTNPMTHWGKGFIIGYGTVIACTKNDDDGGLSCCWSYDSATLVTGASRIRFEGKYLFKMQNYKKIDKKFNPTTRRYDTIWPIALEKTLWDILTCAQTLKECVLPETYSSVLRPALFTDLETQFGLNGGKWYMLPTDCHSCT